MTLFLAALLFSMQTLAQDSEIFLHAQFNKDLSDYEASYQGESSNVSIMNFSGNYDRNINDSLNAEARQAVSLELYTVQPDQYDFLVIFTQFPVDSAGADAFAITYENDTQGIGLPIFDNSSIMGGERLQATIDMTELSDWELNPGNRAFDSTLDTLMHEMMHRWGIYVSFEDGTGQISDLTLGRDNSHWNYFLNTNASVMYGSLWNEIGLNQFTTQAIRKSLSPLDLYLMGFNEPANVPEFFLIEGGSPGDRNDLPSLIGTAVTGNRVDISIEDIIAAEGPRVPSVDGSQHEFNFKFILLKRPNQTVNMNDIGSLVVLQREFQKRFFTETAGIGEIVYPTISDLPEANNPAVLSYDPVNNQQVDFASAEQFIINSYIDEESHWRDKTATQFRDTATVIQALRSLEQPFLTIDASNWLRSTRNAAVTNDHLAWLLISESLTLLQKSAVVLQLLENINQDGGWGLTSGAESSVYDTALVIKGLITAMGNAFEPNENTIAYINQQINLDGGIGYAQGGKSTLTSSALVLSIINDLTGNSDSEQPVIDYIVSLQNPDGGFGLGPSTAHETALIINALNAANNQDHAPITEAAKTKLSTMQSQDGSFEGSVYSSALAIQVLVDDQKPNLVISSAQLSNNQAVAGEQVSVEFTVSNSGGLNAENVSLAILHGQQVIASEQFASIASDQSLSGRLAFDTSALQGSVDLQLFIDHENTIFEANESDNQALLALNVQAQTATPELAIDYSSITLNTDFYDALPFDFQASFNVNNLSSTDLPGVKVDLMKVIDEFNRELLDTVVLNIDANQSQLYSFNTEITAAEGDLELVFVIDPENQIDEVNEDNNEYSVIIDRVMSIDLEIVSDDVSLSSNHVLGVSEEVIFSFKNRGSVDVSPFVARVYLTHDTEDEILLFESDIATMSGGETITRSFNWTPNAIGPYSLTFILDEDNVITEASEVNNSAVIPITVVPNSLTNLSLIKESLNISPLPGLSGLPLTVSVDVINDSAIDGIDFNTSLSYQFRDQAPVLIETKSEQSITANSMRNIMWTIDPLMLSGEVAFIIEIDPDNLIQEFNEEDNILIQNDVRILTKADAAVFRPSISLTPSEPVPGQPLTVEVSVANLGEQDIAPLSIKLYTIDQNSGQEMLVAENQLAQLLAGSSEVSQFDFILSGVDVIKKLRIIADELDSVNEINENNNETVIDFTVQNSEFYVTEKYISPDGNGANDETTIIFNLTQSDDYRVEIFDPYEREVYNFEDQLNAETSFAELTWNGRDSHNQIVKDGVYDVRIEGANTGYTNYLQVVVDTNRNSLLTSMSQGDGYIFDLGCVINDQEGLDMSKDGKYLYNDRYRDKNNVLQRGLFRIKADGTSIESVVSNAFLQNRTLTSHKIINSGDLIFTANANSTSELWRLNVNTGAITELLVPPLTGFRPVSYNENSVLLESLDPANRGYFQAFYDGLTPAVQIDQSIPFDFNNNFSELKHGWYWQVRQGSSSEYDHYYIPKNNLNNPILLNDQGLIPNFGGQVSKDLKTFTAKINGDIIWYRSEEDGVSEIKVISLTGESITNPSQTISPNNELLVLEDGEFQLFDEVGQLKWRVENAFDLEYFKNLIIQQYGSLEELVYEGGDSGPFVYSFSELFNLSIDFGFNENITWVSDTEMYMTYRPRLIASLLIEDFGFTYTDTVSFSSPETLYLKIDYSNLSALEVTELQNMQSVHKEFLEPNGFHFLAGDQVHLKAMNGEPLGNNLNFPEDFNFTLNDFIRFPTADETTSVVRKLLISSNRLNNPLRCTQVGERALGIYQSTANITGYVKADFVQDKVEISGSAFDENFSHYRLEYKQNLSAQNNWNLIQNSDIQRIDESILNWSPIEAGAYTVRLTVFDKAGNFIEDIDEVYVANSNVNIRNVQVLPEYFSPNGDGIKDELKIDFDVLNSSDLTIQILNDSGEAVRTISRQYVGTGNHDQITWNGQNDQGQPLESGEYQVVLPGYNFPVILDLNAPEIKINPTTVVAGLFGLTGSFKKYNGYEGDTWEENQLTELEAFFEYFDSNTGQWIQTLHEQFLQISPDNRDVVNQTQYRVSVVDYAGNIGVSEVFNYEIDSLYLGQVRIDAEPLDVGFPVLKNNCDSGDCYNIFRKEDFSKFLSDEENNQIAFLVQTFSPQVAEDVELEFNYISNDGNVSTETIVLPTNFADLQTAQKYFPEDAELSNTGLPSGMVKFKLGPKTYHAYILMIDSDRLFNARSYAGFSPDLITVNVLFNNYERINSNNLGFIYAPEETNLEFFDNIDAEINSNAYPYNIEDEDFRREYDLIRDKIRNGELGLGDFDHYYWRYSSSDSASINEINNSVLIEYEDDANINNVLLRPIFSNSPGEGNLSQLYGVNLEDCKGIKLVTWNSISSRNREASGVEGGFCLTEDFTEQTFHTQGFCEPLSDPDELIRISVGGLFNTTRTEVASLEVYQIINDLEEVLFTNTNPIGIPVEGRENLLLYLEEFTLNKTDYNEGRHEFFVRYSNVEGVQIIENYEFIVQQENATPEVLQPQALTQYCAAGEEDGDIVIPLDVILNSNSAYYASVFNTENNQFIEGVTDFNYNGVESVSRFGGGFNSELKFKMPSFNGQTSLIFETVNTTGISSCDVVTIAVDSLIDVVVTDKTVENGSFTRFLPTYVSELNVEEYSYLVVNENITVEVDLFETEGAALGAHLATLDAFTAIENEEFSMTWDGKINGLSVADDNYFIQLTITDDCGLVRTTQNRIVVDNTAPIIEFINPVDSANVQSFVAVEAEISEMNYEDSQLAYLTNGTWVPIESENRSLDFPNVLITGDWFLTNLTAGQYTLRLSAQDKVGNEAIEIINVNLAEEQNIFWQFGLSPKFISPNADQVQDESTINFGLNINSLVSVHIEDQNQQLVKEIMNDVSLDPGSHSAAWDGTNDLSGIVSDGDYHVIITASEVGNQSNSQVLSQSIHSDVSPPIIALNPMGQVIKGEDQLGLTVTEENMSKLEVDLLSVEAPVIETPLLDTNASGSFDLLDLADLEETAYQASIQASDLAGNVSYLLHSFEVDNTPPVVIINQPNTESYVGGETLSTVISGSITDEHFSEYQLYISPDIEPRQWELLYTDTSLIDSEFRHDWPITVDDGVYLIRALAVDQAGWESEAIHQITIDSEAPVISISNPQNQSLQGQVIDIQGTVNDLNLDFFHLSFQAVGQTNDDWQLIYTNIETFTNETLFEWSHNLVSGDYRLRLLAQDEVGLVSEDIVSFTLDVQEPEMPLYLNAELINREDVHLNWEASASSDVIGYWVYRDNNVINETLINLTSYQDLSLFEGEFSYWVVAVDAAGNSSSPSNIENVIVDRTGPEVSMQFPANNQVVSGLAEIYGTAFSDDDFFNWQLFYREQNDPLPGILLSQSSLQINGQKLAELDTSSLTQDAVYVLRLEARDLSQNVSSIERSVQIDNSPPTAPVNLTYQLNNGNDVELNWSVNSESDLAGYLVYRNGEIISGTGIVDSSIIIDTSFIDADVFDGTHTYFVVAIDQANNVSGPSNTVEVIIDLRPPHAVFTSPADGHEFEAPLRMVAVSDDIDVASVLFEYSTDGFTWNNISIDESTPFEAVIDAEGLSLSYGTLQLRATATDINSQIDPFPDRVSVMYTDLTAPETVTGLYGLVTGVDVQLDWAANEETDLAGYIVSRKQLAPDLEEDFTVLTSPVVAVNQYVDTGLSEGTYVYRVSAVDTFDNQAEGIDSTELTIFAIELKQPFSPVLAPAALQLNGTTDFNGDITATMNNDAGLVSLNPAAVNPEGSFQFESTQLEIGDNFFTAIQLTIDGHSSIASDTTVQLSPIPAPPINPMTNLSVFDLNFNWDSPDLQTIGYLPYIDGQPVEHIEQLSESLTVSASSNTGISNRTIDGNEGSYWNPSTSDTVDGVPVYIEVSFAEPNWITQVDISWLENSNADAFEPNQYLLQYQSPVGWITQSDFSGNTSSFVSYESQIPYLTQAIRIWMPLGEDYTGSFIALSEMKIFHQPFVDELSYSITLTDGLYDVQVSAINNYGFESEKTTAQSIVVGDVIPPEPVTLMATVQNANQVLLDWSSSSSIDVASYRIFRNGNLIAATADGATLNYLDIGVSNGSYTYQVVVVDTADNLSDYSNEVSVEINQQLLDPPTGLIVNSENTGQVLSLAWDEVLNPNLSHYLIYRSTNALDGFEYIGQSVDAHFVDDGLTNGSRYYYYITSVDQFENESLPSIIASGVPFDLIAPIQPAITNPTTAGTPISVNDLSINITGDGSPGVEVDLYHNNELVDTVASTSEFSLVEVRLPRSIDNVRYNGRNNFFTYNDFNTGELMLADFDNETFTAVNGSSLRYSTWSENGDKIYVTSRFGSQTELNSYGLDGELQNNLVSGFNINAFTVNEDESQVFYWGDGINPDTGLAEEGLWIYTFSDGNYQKLEVNDSTQIAYYAVEWLPSGGIAFINYPSGANSDGDLWLMETTGSALQMVEGGLPGRTALSTNVQGTHLYFSANVNANKAIKRYRITDGDIQVYAQAGNDLTLPFVKQNIDLVLINVGCCTKEIVNIATGQILQQFTNTGNESTVNWSDEGSIILLSQVGFTQSIFKVINLPGVFEFVNVDLFSGLNEFYVIARKDNGLSSEPSDSIEVTLNESVLADLEIKPSYLQLIPSQVFAGQSLSGSVLVKNNSLVDVEQTRLLIELIDPDLNSQLIEPAPLDFSLAAGELLVENFTVDNLNILGEYTVRVLVDSNQQVLEINENNNSVVKTIQVIDDLYADLEVVLFDNELFPGTDLTGSMRIYNPGASFNGSVSLRITDSEGYPVGFEQTYVINELLTASAWEQGIIWNTADVFAGFYVVEVVLHDENEQILEQQQVNFNVSETAEFEVSLTSNLSQIPVNQAVNFVVDINYLTGNSIQSGELIWQIFDDSQQLVWSNTQSLGAMSPGFNGEFENTWSTAQAGTYQARVTLNTPLALEVANIPFEVTSVAAQVSLTGGINSLPEGVILGQTWNSPYTIQNVGQIDVTNVPLSLSLWNSDLSQMIGQQNASVSLNAGMNTQLTANWDSNNLLLENYVLVLTADLSGFGASGTYLIDTVSVQAVDATAPQISINNPVALGYYPNHVELRIDVIDLHADVDSVAVYLDGNLVENLPAQANNPIYAYALNNLAEGPHVLNIVAKDIFDNSGSESLTFNVDGTAPLIAITGVEEAGLYNQTVQANVVISDNNLSNSQIILDGMPYTSTADISSEGSHILIASAEDLAGNTNSVRVSFNIDLTAPTVSISYPANNSEIAEDTTVVSGNTEAFATVTLTSGAYTATITADFAGNFNFADVPLASGENTIAVSSVDRAGNAGGVSTVLVNFIDAIIVNGFLTTPSTQGIGSDLTVAWQLSNLNSSEVTDLPVEVNLYRTTDNQLLLSDMRTLSISAAGNVMLDSVFDTSTLSVGDHRIELRIQIDGVWQTLDVDLVLLEDVIGPEVTVIEPVLNQVSQSTVDFLVQASDVHSDVDAVNYQLDNSGIWLPLNWDGMVYSLQLEIEHGSHEVMFQAVDTYNNETLSTAIQFTVDTENPVINVVTPTDGLITNQSVTIDFNVTDDHSFTVVAELDQNTITNGDVVTAEGEYELQISATDEVNNMAQLSRSFIIDTTPPSLVVTTPVNGSQNITGFQDIIGSAEARNVITITVNGVESTIKTDAVGGFILPAQALQLGANQIEVIATDQAGNASDPVLLSVTYTQVSEITGRVWQDEDQNGTIGLGEPGFSGVALRLTDSENASQDVSTDVNGFYSFENTLPGTYTLAVIENDLLDNWFNTTANNPSMVEVVADQDLQVDFGFYQDKAQLEASLSAHSIKGRLLILADLPTAQVDIGSCVGVANYQLQRMMTNEFVEGDIVWAQLYDSQENLLQTETASYADFVANGLQPIDQQAETNEFNLLLLPVANRQIQAKVISSSSASALTNDYRVVLGLESNGDSFEWSSDPISVACATYEQVGQPTGDLNIANVGLFPALASDDPNGSTAAPHLNAQYVMLENILQDAGWSYEMTTDESEFATQLASGEFVAYWLMAENVLLSNPVQNDLINAMNLGAGLMVSSGHDNLSKQFYSSLGVQISGNHDTITAIELSESPIASSGVLDVLSDEQGLRASLIAGPSDVTQSAATFSGLNIVAPENQAITWLDNLEGSTIFSSLDLLLQATADMSLSGYIQLIKDAIAYSHPLGLSNDIGYARAMQFNLQNLGRPIDGYVQVLLPASVTLVHAEIPVIPNVDGFRFDYDLLDNQLLELEFWVTLNASPATVTFEIYLGDDTTVFETLDLVLIAGERPDLSVSISNCQSGAHPDQLLSYQLAINNNGNVQINQAQLDSSFTSGLTGISWTCTATNGSACHQPSGVGGLSAVNIDVAAGGAVNYVFDAQVGQQPIDAVTASAAVLMPGLVGDVNPGDNEASDTDAVYEFLFKNGFECAAPGDDSSLLKDALRSVPKGQE